MFKSLSNIVKDSVKIVALPLTLACTVTKPAVKVVEDVVQDIRKTVEGKDVL